MIFLFTQSKCQNVFLNLLGSILLEPPFLLFQGKSGSLREALPPVSQTLPLFLGPTLSCRDMQHLGARQEVAAFAPSHPHIISINPPSPKSPLDAVIRGGGFPNLTLRRNWGSIPPTSTLYWPGVWIDHEGTLVAWGDFSCSRCGSGMSAKPKLIHSEWNSGLHAMFGGRGTLSLFLDVNKDMTPEVLAATITMREASLEPKRSHGGGRAWEKTDTSPAVLIRLRISGANQPLNLSYLGMF